MPSQQKLWQRGQRVWQFDQVQPGWLHGPVFNMPISMSVTTQISLHSMLFECQAVQGKYLHKVLGSRVVLVTHMMLHRNLLCSTSNMAQTGWSWQIRSAAQYSGVFI